MKKHWPVAFFLACLLPTAWAQRAYTIAYNEATAPLVPLVKAVYAEIGMQPVFELLPSERAISETNRGHYDADIGRVGQVVQMYPNLVHTQVPLLQTDLYAYAKKGAGIVVHHKNQLRQHTLGLIRGSKLAEGFVKKEGLAAESANSMDSFFQMLMIGRFDIALVTSTQLISQAARFSAVAERVGPVLESTVSYHVLNKKHADLIPKLDAVLKAMKGDGRMAKYLAAG